MVRTVGKAKRAVGGSALALLLRLPAAGQAASVPPADPGADNHILVRPIPGVPGLGGTLEPTDDIPTGTADTLVAMADRAGAIFAGQVLAVTRRDDLGYVEVRFAVESAVRGVQVGGSYLLREWAGLWSGGPERYRVGQRRLMLLTAASASGLSAPVEGAAGSIPLLAVAAPPLLDRNGQPTADIGGGETGLACDLRWVEARSPRAQPQSASGNVSAQPGDGLWTLTPAPSGSPSWQPASPLATTASGQSSTAAVRLPAVLALLGARLPQLAGPGMAQAGDGHGR